MAEGHLLGKRILVLGKGTLCEELRAADLHAHGEDAVAVPDHRAQGGAGQRTAVPGQRRRPVEPGRAAQAAGPAGGQGRRAGLPPAPVPPHLCRELPALHSLFSDAGHSDTAMVKRYARIAQTDRAACLWDCAEAQQKASAVDSGGL